MSGKVKDLLREGNVRRITIRKDQGDAVMEIPVTAGVVAAIVAPVLIGVAAIAALASEWEIDIDRTSPRASVADQARTSTLRGCSATRSLASAPISSATPVRGLAEMAYQSRQPFVLDTSKYRASFGISSTPLATAVADTIAWYRTHYVTAARAISIRRVAHS
jgi:hypothetical protein